ncbi:hypothetical protein ACUNEG_16170 [Serratia sp. IR-2025]
MNPQINYIKIQNQKFLKKITIVVTAILIATLGLYFYKFHHGLSNNPTDWASFGSYVGGVLGPIFSGLSLLVLSLTFYHSKENDIRQMSLAIKEQNLRKIQDISRALKENMKSKDYYSSMFGDADFYRYMKKLEGYLSAEIAIKYYSCEDEYWEKYIKYFELSHIDLSDEIRLFLEAYQTIKNSEDKSILQATFNSAVSKEMRFLLCLYGLNNIDNFDKLCSEWTGFKTIPWQINYPEETE